jgi:hypothetical protein
VWKPRAKITRNSEERSDGCVGIAAHKLTDNYYKLVLSYNNYTFAVNNLIKYFVTSYAYMSDSRYICLR